MKSKLIFIRKKQNFLKNPTTKKCHQSWKMTFCFVFCFDYWVFQNILIFPNENQLGFHMRYHLFLHYGWFLQNLGKDFIRTNMHTTVRQHGCSGCLHLQFLRDVSICPSIFWPAFTKLQIQFLKNFYDYLVICIRTQFQTQALYTQCVYSFIFIDFLIVTLKDLSVQHQQYVYSRFRIYLDF